MYIQQRGIEKICFQCVHDDGSRNMIQKFTPYSFIDSQETVNLKYFLVSVGEFAHNSPS